MQQLPGPCCRQAPVSASGGSSLNLKDRKDLADGRHRGKRKEERGVTADDHEHNVCGLGSGGGNSGQPRVDSRTQTRHSPPPDWCVGSEARGLHLHSDAPVLHFCNFATSKENPHLPTTPRSPPLQDPKRPPLQGPKRPSPFIASGQVDW